MHLSKKLTRLLFSTALAVSGIALTLPGAFAQSTAVGTSHSSASLPNGSLEKSHGAWRTSKLDGAAVYNENGNNIGSITDMLADSSGNIANVVISVGGFLGQGDKLIEVPFSKLKFEPSKSNGATNVGQSSRTSTSQANGQDYSIVLPNVTKDALTSMTAFNF